MIANVCRLLYVRDVYSDQEVVLSCGYDIYVSNYKCDREYLVKVSFRTIYRLLGFIVC